jgi:spore coat protein A, manganese oxidase
VDGLYRCIGEFEWKSGARLSSSAGFPEKIVVHGTQRNKVFYLRMRGACREQWGGTDAPRHRRKLKNGNRSTDVIRTRRRGKIPHETQVWRATFDCAAMEMESLTTRRTFLRQSAIAAAAAAVARPAYSKMMVAPAARVPILNPETLARFVDPLPRPVVARPQGMREIQGRQGEQAPFFRISMRPTTTKLHRDLPPTNQWSYGGLVPGVMFDTESHKGMLVEWVNELPAQHFLPIDYSVHGAGRNVPEVRSVVHLHGGKTPSESDGYPEEWYVPGESRTYYYPNQQEPALLWYHDHAMGITRLNIYAGLLGLHVIRDQAERQLNLPDGEYEIPLVLFDRHIQLDGQLSYPVSRNPEHPWISEVRGEVPLVNGKIFPYLEVEPRKYRIRVLNASNGRLFRLSLSPDVEVHQIGSDQGLLPAPVALNHVVLSPAERADLVIDFAAHRGTRIVLADDAFPELMEFRVGQSKVSDPSSLPSSLRPVPRIGESSAVKTRWLTLDELTNGGKGASMGMLLNKTPWHMPISEKPTLGTTEIWELANMTEDIHPIHLHLVRFQILDRRPFDAYHYSTTGILHYTSSATPPDPEEMGWKDTVRVNGRTVTRIIVPFMGYTGLYVWHCHNLEHEDNEMMRPYAVLASGVGPQDVQPKGG